MRELHKSVKRDNLLFKYVGNTKDVDFSKYINAESLFDMIKNKKIKLSHAEEKQEELKSNLADIKIGRKNYEQNNTIKNIENLRKS